MLAVVGGWRSPLLDRTMVAVTHLGGWKGTALLMFVATVILLGLKKAKATLYLLASVGGAALGTSILKEIWQRERPEGGLLDIMSFAFPSWHASVAAATSLSLLLILLPNVPVRYRGILMMLSLSWPLLIGFSRIYLHVHWFTDVLAGWGVGLFWASAVAVIMKMDMKNGRS